MTGKSPAGKSQGCSVSNAYAYTLQHAVGDDERGEGGLHRPVGDANAQIHDEAAQEDGPPVAEPLAKQAHNVHADCLTC
jgi:hypothetical protein